MTGGWRKTRLDALFVRLRRLVCAIAALAIRSGGRKGGVKTWRRCVCVSMRACACVCRDAPKVQAHPLHGASSHTYTLEEIIHGLPQGPLIADRQARQLPCTCAKANTMARGGAGQEREGEEGSERDEGMMVTASRYVREGSQEKRQGNSSHEWIDGLRINNQDVSVIGEQQGGR